MSHSYLDSTPCKNYWLLFTHLYSTKAASQAHQPTQRKRINTENKEIEIVTRQNENSRDLGSGTPEFAHGAWTQRQKPTSRRDAPNFACMAGCPMGMRPTLYYIKRAKRRLYALALKTSNNNRVLKKIE